MHFGIQVFGLQDLLYKKSLGAFSQFLHSETKLFDVAIAQNHSWLPSSAECFGHVFTILRAHKSLMQYSGTFKVLDSDFRMLIKMLPVWTHFDY